MDGENREAQAHGGLNPQAGEGAREYGMKLVGCVMGGEPTEAGCMCRVELTVGGWE